MCQTVILADGRRGRSGDRFASHKTMGTNPKDIEAIVSRMGYLPSLAQRLFDHFQKIGNVENIWFSLEGNPLKWHYPVGVLYDVYGRDALPWKINVSFQDFPQEKVLPAPNLDAVKAHFMNILKQVNSLSFADAQTLWSGVVEANPETFDKTNRMLVADLQSMKNVPVRFIVNGQLPCLQEPIPPLVAGVPSILRQVLAELGFPTKQAIIQGIEVSPDASIAWLYQHLAHPDNFMYVLLR